MVLADKRAESDVEDVSSIDINLNTLVGRFITPIDRIRSLAVPNTLIGRAQRRLDSTLAGIQKAISVELRSAIRSEDNALESRAHAYYRALGLPVMAQSGAFFNPGFNPKQLAKARTENFRISNSIDDNIIFMQAFRENRSQQQSFLFRTALTNASALAAVMDRPNKFQVIDTNLGIFDRDLQENTLSARRRFLINNYTDKDGNQITDRTLNGFNFAVDKISHPIRPFLVDPTIIEVIQPDERQIAVPFLQSRNDLRLEAGKFVFRPGIEFVLTLRLSQTPLNESDVLESIIFGVDPEASLELASVSAAEAKQLVFALLGERAVSADDIDFLTTTPFEFVQINVLVKTIKALAIKLSEAVDTIFNVANNIEWTPLPGEFGPEDEANLKIAGLIRQRVFSSELEKRIRELETKISINKLKGDTKINSNEYIISSYENAQNLFQKELNEAKEQRADFVSRGARALRTIEVITGEVSGIGLVDMVAIYTALWAIDIDVLISLLDENAFNRLYESRPDLRNTNVESRRSSGAVFSGIEAMERFQTQIVNLLSFADSVFNKQFSTDEQSGTPKG